MTRRRSTTAGPAARRLEWSGRMRDLLTIILICTVGSGAYAQSGCEGLAPSNAQDIEESFKGTIEGSISGLIGRLTGANASLSGEYKALYKDTLVGYPESHKLYVWQRIIYLACIQPERSIDIDRLFQSYLSGPPDIVESNESESSGRQNQFGFACKDSGIYSTGNKSPVLPCANGDVTINY